MATNEPNQALRLTFLVVIVGVLFVALFSRLWFLQVLAGDRYAQLSEQNRVQPVYTDAPRGRILGANGKPLVKNRASLVISANKRTLLEPATSEPLDEGAERVLERLSRLLDLEVDEIVTRLNDRKYSPFSPAPIEFDVPTEVVYTVREHQELFPGVVAETRPVREYPHASLAAHVLGQTGEISQEDLDREPFADYRAGDTIGTAGLERSYEQQLQGERGRRLLEVNAQGTVVGVLDEREPVPGDDLKTTIDTKLQRATERLLADGLVESRETVVRSDGQPVPSVAGSVVVLDPDTGAVKAMASNPTFDPRKFVGGLSQRYANYFYNIGKKELPTVPGENLAIQEALSPGSTFKIVTGAAFLEAGLIDTSSLVGCPPSRTIGGRTFNNWNSYDEGAMDISTALKRSCDTFFYELASRQYGREERAIDSGDKPEEAMSDVARKFGFGRELGIDLPSETAGLIPDREWKREFHTQMEDTWCEQAETGEPRAYGTQVAQENCDSFFVWKPGDPVNMSIGQGFVTATPLQIASAFGAIANGGRLMWPHVGARVLTPDGEVAERIKPRRLNRLPLGDGQIAAIQDGLERVVMEDGGTATTAFSGFDFDKVTVAGKTGTSEAFDQVPDAWFAAYAPVDDPEYVVAVAVEEGSGGSVTAAPIARRILEAAFDLDVAEFEAGEPTD